MTDEELEFFVRESNRIEGILRDPTKAELEEAKRFLALEALTVLQVEKFVSVYQPGAKLRTKPGMNVAIGLYYPPPGGSTIKPQLQDILKRANDGEDPYVLHHEYETLHPFMDGNGRSGRIVWAWQQIQQNRWPGLRLGFLHTWYYSSLSHGRSK
jgi:fido (protein-threonine AMPylation protein)